MLAKYIGEDNFSDVTHPITSVIYTINKFTWTVVPDDLQATMEGAGVYALQISAPCSGNTTTSLNVISSLTAGSMYSNTLDVATASNMAIGATVGANTISIGGATTEVTISGNLIVNGTSTVIESTTLQVDDKNIELGVVTTPTDITADGGGITLLGDTNKTILYTNATTTWDFSEDINVPTGKTYKIDNVNLLDTTQTLGASDVVGATQNAIKVYVDGKVAWSTTAELTTGYNMPTVNATAIFDCTAGALTATLPLANTVSGVKYHIKKTDASLNAVTIQTSGADTIDGAASKSLTGQWQSMTIQSNGNAYYILQ